MVVRMAQSHMTIRKTVVLHAPLAQLWPLVSDTNRVNRLLGLPAFEHSDPDADLVQQISSHYRGLPVTWREHPFAWVFEQWFRVEREFAPPLPFTTMITDTRLEALDEHSTIVDVIVQVQPRGVIGRAAVHALVERGLMRDLVAIYQSFEQLVQRAQAVPLTRFRSPAQRDQLASGLLRLRRQNVPDDLVAQLGVHLAEADDPDVLRMRPFALADAWGADRLEVLRVFLHATRSGLLDMEWDVLCPNCRGPSVRLDRLADVAADAHCPACNIRYDVNFDESVELRFNVRPAVRMATDATYCIGGPASTRHVLAQVWVPARGATTLPLRLAADEYRIRTRQTTGRATLIVREDAAPQATAVSVHGEQVAVEHTAVRAGMVELHIQNTTDEPVLVMLEESAWSRQAAGAALVTSLAEFRALFSAEVLAPGVDLAVRTLAFLFSDLKGSTVIYETIGDSPAYARVRDHFTLLSEQVAAHNGTVVKTIGDAVMAVFAVPGDALAAALAIQRAFAEESIALQEPMLKVKIGLHCGACIAVNANGVLDYFGSTVNTAARVQGQSIGGDVVLSEAMAHDPAVATLLADGSPVEAFRCQLRGLSGEQRLYRVQPLALQTR